MKLESILFLINDINEKFETHSVDKKSPTYYEVLHSSLSLVIREWTEEQFNSIPAPQRKTIEKLEESILKFVSQEYLDSVKQFEKENGRFRKASKAITKCNQQIGFIQNLEEGTTI